MTTLLTEAPAAQQMPAAVVAAANPDAPPAAVAVAADAARWTVPEDMRTHDSVRKFADDKHTLDPGVLLKSYVNLEGQLGRDKIVIPKTDEDWGKAWDALGRPATPEAYEPPKIELAEGVAADPEGEKFLRSFGHQNGWNQKQFQNAYEAFYKHTLDQKAAWQSTVNEQRSTVESSLKKEWGEAYEQETQRAKLAFQEFGDAEFAQMLEQTGLGNDPRLVRVFNKIGREMRGDDKLKGQGGGAGGVMTPSEIAAKIKTFRETNNSALFDADHPDHKRLVSELEALHKAQAAGQAAGR